jgi:hypothetical protein
MPNFLQAIGQSNLQDTMRNLTNTALNIRQMQNQEQHMRAIEAHQDQALELQRQNTEAERLKAQEYKRQQELIDIDNELGRIGFTSPEEIAYFKKKAGLHVENVGGRDYIQRGVGTKLFMDAAKDPQSNIEVGTIRIGNLDKQIAQLETAMAGGGQGVGGSGNNSNTQGNKPAMKLKPEQVQQLGVQLQQLREQRTQLVNNMKIEQRKLDAQLKEKRYLPNSPNGMFDTETQQVVAGTRKPEEKWSLPFEIKVGDKTIKVQKNEQGKYSSIGSDTANGEVDNKKIKQTIAYLQRYRSNNAAEIARRQRDAEPTNNLEEAQRVIDDTISQVLAGTISPDDIVWSNTVDLDVPPPASTGKKARKVLDKETGRKLFAKANGDYDLFEKLARDAGY